MNRIEEIMNRPEWKLEDSITIAVYAARLALPVWKRVWENDNRPDCAIDAAEKFEIEKEAAVNADDSARLAADYGFYPAFHAAMSAANAAYINVVSDCNKLYFAKTAIESAVMAAGEYVADKCYDRAMELIKIKVQ